ncbi:hypothetical protein ACFOSC_07110 [Streptantibioticus rubrisoli]|uniref:Secreted protein n=1 Tax=Streptantibioticus rubrisoli TaxID=1387313 RepID=A0ABT1P6Y0_9ACTN|nr:hypothetical protein [Streptantibioticus rubrisoli]MCQ4041129.1 hypothetical protein [Streptantibioticus rubrisoli]
MNPGLLSAAAAIVYAATVSLLALTATFARRAVRRRAARDTLLLLVPRRHFGCPAGGEETSRAAGVGAVGLRPAARSEAPNAARSRW